ncbi:MAG: hypothetical protein EBX61_08780 [Betaproteobacteria bacterium]|nr:hypothetical protein [Betaproteobacteria bacterium]
MSSFPYAKTWTKSQAEVTTQERAATALLVLANIKAGSRLWGYSRFVLGTWPLRQLGRSRRKREGCSTDPSLDTLASCWRVLG